MITLSQIQRHFHSVRKPALKPRSTVGSECLTKEFALATWVLIGVADDRGVENNFGRTGAAGGPAGFRKWFFSHPIANVQPASQSIYDIGNFKLGKKLDQSLTQLKTAIHEIKTLDYTKKILVIGGGHDIAYSEIAGCLQSSKSPREHAIVNIDAHSDVRPIEKDGKITSGTPFFRLIEEEGVVARQYIPFGLQQTSNSKDLVQWMKSKDIRPHWLEEMVDPSSQRERFLTLIQSLSNQPWHLSIDMDAFPSSISPGVSAPAIWGLSPDIFLSLYRAKEALEKIQSLGIYELAPSLDEGDRSQRLAAKLAYLILSL